MWRIPLAFILLISFLFICHRIGDHIKISQDGGIRKKFNRLFSFLYSLPGSKIIIETKSFVKFNIRTNSLKASFILNYSMDMLDIKFTISYLDETAFNNGITKGWSVNRYTSEDKVLLQIIDYLEHLPKFEIK